MSILKSLAIIFIVLIIGTLKNYGQSSLPQEKDTTVRVGPSFKGGIPGIMKYFNKEIAPVIIQSTKDDNNLPFSLNMILTINKTGRVINVEFPDSRMEENCVNAVTNSLLKMKGWKAGKYNGKKVVGNYPCKISICWQ